MPNQANAIKTKSDGDPLKDEKSGKVREVGSQAVWSLSSCKPGKSVIKLFSLGNQFHNFCVCVPKIRWFVKYYIYVRNEISCNLIAT